MKKSTSNHGYMNGLLLASPSPILFWDRTVAPSNGDFGAPSNGDYRALRMGTLIHPSSGDYGAPFVWGLCCPLRVGTLLPPSSGKFVPLSNGDLGAPFDWGLNWCNIALRWQSFSAFRLFTFLQIYLTLIASEVKRSEAPSTCNGIWQQMLKSLKIVVENFWKRRNSYFGVNNPFLMWTGPARPGPARPDHDAVWRIISLPLFKRATWKFKTI